MKIDKSHLKKEMKALKKVVDPSLAEQLDKAIEAMPDIGLARVVCQTLHSGGAGLVHYPEMRKLAGS